MGGDVEMRFEIEKLEMDFGDTPIENIFLNDYMPQADGNFVKVYLAGYQMAKQGPNEKAEMNHGDIARRLNILETDVLRAWDYWQEQGIVEKILTPDGDSYGIRFLNLKELYTKNIYTSKKEKKEEGTSFFQSLENPEIANLFSQAAYYMRRDIPYQKKMEIASWIEVYNMPPALIIEAFRYGTERKGKRSIPYVEGIVRNWADDNVRTKEALEENFRTRDEMYYRYSRLLQLMGLGHKGYIEEDVIRVEGWIRSWGFSMEMLEAAAKRTSQSKNPNWNYMEKILASWKAKDIMKPEDLHKDQKPSRQRVARKNIENSRTEKYSSKALDDMAKKKWQDYIDKLRKED